MPNLSHKDSAVPKEDKTETCQFSDESACPVALGALILFRTERGGLLGHIVHKEYSLTEPCVVTVDRMGKHKQLRRVFANDITRVLSEDMPTQTKEVSMTAPVKPCQFETPQGCALGKGAVVEFKTAHCKTTGTILRKEPQEHAPCELIVETRSGHQKRIGANAVTRNLGLGE